MTRLHNFAIDLKQINLLPRIIVLLLLISELTTAQDTIVNQYNTTPLEIEDIIVTATRTYRELSSLPLKSNIITKETIENTNSLRLSDILNEQTGLITIPDFGGGQGLQLQGLDSEYTLIMIDGAPLIGRSAGTLDLNRISVTNVKQIEIVKGASSCLYGNEALGGVINIITEKPTDGFSAELQGRYGSLNTSDISANGRYQKRKTSATISANRYGSGGYRLNSNSITPTVAPFRNYTTHGKLKYAFNKNTSISLSSRYFYQNQDVISTSDNGEAINKEINNHVKVSHSFDDKWKIETELYHTNFLAEDYESTINGLEEISQFDQTLLKPETRIHLQLSKHNTLLGGIGLTHESLTRSDFILNPEFNAPYGYLQYDTSPNDKLNIIGGFRYDSHSAYKAQLSPKLAARYTFNDKLVLRASVGYGYKAPAFRQLYFDFTNSTVGYTVLGYYAVQSRIPDLNAKGEIINVIVPISSFSNQLNPENSVSLNVGIDYYHSSDLEIKVNVFQNQISDLIDTRIIARKTNGQNVFSYYNVKRVSTKGLEIDTKFKGFRNIIVSAGYQLLFAFDQDARSAFRDGTIYGRTSPATPSFQMKSSDYFGLYNRSRHMANVKVDYNSTDAKWNTNIRGVYRSKYGLYDSNGNSYLDKYDEFVSGYMIWDIAINRKLINNYKIGLGINNILGFTNTENISNLSGKLFYANLKINI
ncbi:MAG: outer membrane receptor for ferrienterochelin and colicins [Saprospiraceae bacterium]|jgi:outer membrane receptor for ferrienterochelin and colicins